MRWACERQLVSMTGLIRPPPFKNTCTLNFLTLILLLFLGFLLKSVIITDRKSVPPNSASIYNVLKNRHGKRKWLTFLFFAKKILFFRFLWKNPRLREMLISLCTHYKPRPMTQDVTVLEREENLKKSNLAMP